MNDISLIPIRKEKLLIAISVNMVDAPTIVKWCKKFKNRLECRHDGSSEIVEISEVTYYEFMDLIMDYTWAITPKGGRIKLLFKHSENKYYNVLPRPRIDVFLYSE